jgi:uncharacterized protein YyaL (SSP411 family)
MLSDEGYFFAGQDSDSEGVQGLYFTFTKDEFIDAIVDFDENLIDKMDTLLEWFDISEKGNFERDLNVISLNSKHKEAYYSPEGWNDVRAVRQALSEARKMRIPPATDCKGVASWNFQIVSALVDVVQYCKVESISLQASELLNQTTASIHKAFIKQIDGKSKIITSTTRETHMPLFENYVMFCECQFRFYEISGNKTFKESGDKTIDYIMKEFFDDGLFMTRPLNFSDAHQYKNIHTPVFDQNYKSSLATFIGLLRKWKHLEEGKERLNSIVKTVDTLTHLSLQNPLMFGETLRSLAYPDEAYREITIPLKWLKDQSFSKFYPHFSVRFALNFSEEENEKWLIRTYDEVELQGTSLKEFEEIFDVKSSN